MDFNSKSGLVDGTLKKSNPRLLLDCSLCRVGGALQVAMSFIARGVLDTEFTLGVISSPELDQLIPHSLVSTLPLYQISSNSPSPLGELSNQKILQRAEKEFSPTMSYTLFGPSLWRSAVPHVEGFARPHLIYPDPLPQSGRLKQLQIALALSWARFRLDPSKKFVVETETVRKRFSKQFDIHPGRIFVIRNSYSIQFAESLDRNHYLAANALPVIFLIPSAGYLHKNLNILPKVAKILYDGGTRDFLFRFVLQEGGSEWQAILRSASRMGIQGHFETIGTVRVQNMADEYLKASAILLPTLMECSTAVYPEALLAKRLICTSNLDFASEACGTNAIYFDPTKPSDIAQKLAEVISDPVSLLTSAESQNSQLRNSYPTPDEQWEDYKKMFRSLGDF